jgi:glycosyltransferase involved in cell wall biosynthesis
MGGSILMEDSLKIGFVTPEYPPNGSGGAQSVKLLVEELRDQGYQVEVISFGEECAGPEYLQRNHIETTRLDLKNLKARAKIKEFARDKDLIHCYSPKFMPAVATLRNVKTIVTLNNYKYFYPYSIPGMEKNPTSRVYRTLHDFTCRKLMKRIDRFVALSTAVKEQYSQILPEEKIQVIPNMYDPEFKIDKNIETDEKEILYVGRLHEIKGIEDLIEAMNNLEDYHLRIIGTGDQKQQLQEKTKKQNLEDRVKFEGYIQHEKLPEYYSQAGWFIHPSKWPEPLNRTLFESMQTETALLCSHMGGAKDVIHKEQIFEKPSEIPEKIRKLDREEIVGRQNSKLEEYSPKKVINRLEEVYK